MQEGYGRSTAKPPRNMKFSIRDILWIMAIVGITGGWVRDRTVAMRSHDNEVIKLHRELDEVKSDASRWQWQAEFLAYTLVQDGYELEMVGRNVNSITSPPLLHLLRQKLRDIIAFYMQEFSDRR